MHKNIFLYYETTKLRNYETTKLRNYETTKLRNYETTKLRNYETTKIIFVKVLTTLTIFNYIFMVL